MLAKGGFSGIECALFGTVGCIEGLQERLIEMGGVKKERRIRHEVYSPTKHEVYSPTKHTVYSPAIVDGVRSGALLHVYNDGSSTKLINYTPGDYATTERSTIFNVIESAIFEDDSAPDCLQLFDYRLIKAQEYTTYLFSDLAGVTAASVEARKEGDDPQKWTIVATIRCRDRKELVRAEEDLHRIVSYCDDIVKLSMVDRRQFQW